MVLASDKQTGEQVALKFIKRGRQVKSRCYILQRCARLSAAYRIYRRRRARRRAPQRPRRPWAAPAGHLLLGKRPPERLLPPSPPRPAQINKYVEREIINHMSLQHPHVVWLQEVLTGEQGLAAAAAEVAAGRPPRPWRPRGRDLPFPRRR